MEQASPWRPEHNVQEEDWASGCGRQDIGGGNVHEQWVRKVVQETGQYGNVVYQDGNEIAVRAGYAPAWSLSMSDIIHDEEERNGYLRHLVGTNSENVNTMQAPEIDYIEFHSEDAPNPAFGKPTGTNEYNPTPPFTAADLHGRYCDGRRQGTYFWYWRHGQTERQMDRTLELIKGGCASGGSNLVPNPSFESGTGGDAFNWTEAVNHARASDNAADGDWSLKSTLSGAGGVATYSASIPVTANTNYTLSAWIYRSDPAGSAYVDMSDIPGEIQLVSTAQTGVWQHVSSPWNSGSRNSVTLRCVTDSGINGPVWFDDVSLVRQ